MVNGLSSKSLQAKDKPGQQAHLLEYYSTLHPALGHLGYTNFGQNNPTFRDFFTKTNIKCQLNSFPQGKKSSKVNDNTSTPEQPCT
jgi:hypothetical protein